MKHFPKLILLMCLLLGLPAQAAISLNPGSTQSCQLDGFFARNCSFSLPAPAGASAGDLLMVQIVARDDTAITPPAGWSELEAAGTTSNGMQQRVYFLNTSSAPGASSWNFSGPWLGARNYIVAAIYGVRGAEVANCSSGNTTNCAGARQAGGGNTITAPNVQSQPPTYPAGSLRLAFFGASQGNATITPALQDGATAGLNIRAGSNTDGVALHGSHYILPFESNGGQQNASVTANPGSIGSTVILRASPAPTLTCVTDNFNRSTGLGDDWVSVRVAGSFTPAIVSNRLRLTTTATNQSTGVSFQRLFPAADNFVQLTYRYYGYGGSGADGIAVILSDAGITPQPGGFGGSLGYAPKGATPGFAGGWLGVGLDEYGNFSNRNDSGPCAPGVSGCSSSRIVQSIGIRGSAPNYYWLTGTPTLNPTVSNTAGHLYRLTIDSRVAGQTLVSVERDTTGSGNNYATLIGAFNAMTASGQAAVPENLVLSFTGSTGGSTNNHEIDDLQICAQRTSGMQAQIDHYRFAVATTPLTCTPASVTVRACMDATCSTTYTGNVTATLLPTGWVGGDTVTFAGSGANLSLSKTTAGSYTLGVSASTPQLKAFSQPQCSINGSAYSTSCGLTFADAGFLYTVPPQTSGVTSGAITITAAKTDDVTRRCVPAFAGVTRNVGFWSGYVSPATGTLSLTVQGSNIAKISPGTAVPLNFDANGQATITLNYPDAGEISLNARYAGAVATGDAGLVMTGSSTFPVVPYRLCVDSPDAGWSCAATSAQAQNPANCAPFRTAGDAFNLRVTGKAANGAITDACALPTTPNYIQANIPLSSSVFAPTGGDNGGLSVPTISIASGGTATMSTTQREVGVFTLSATPTAGTYTSFGQTVPAGSGVFGRFIPAGFTLGVSPLLNRVAANCSTPADFTYLGEQLGSDFTLSAVNLAGGPTRNYRDAFARLNLAPVSSAGSNGLAFGAQDGSTLLNTRLSVTCSSCPPFANGMTALQTRLAVGRAPGGVIDGPFAAARFGLVATDADGVGMRTPDFNWDLAGSAEGVSLGTTRLLFGRLRVDNAYGSALLPLPVPVRAQAWSGTGFIDHGADSCTPIQVPVTIAVNAGTFPALSCNGGVGLYGSLSGVVASAAGVAAGSTTRLVNGSLLLNLGKPADPAGGYLDLVLAAPDYLKFDVDGVDQSLPGCSTPGDGYLHDDNPRARIRFGVKTNQGVIHQREVY